MGPPRVHKERHRKRGDSNLSIVDFNRPADETITDDDPNYAIVSTSDVFLENQGSWIIQVDNFTMLPGDTIEIDGPVSMRLRIRFLSAFSFSLATFTRSILYTYIGILALFTCYGIGFFLTKDMETEAFAVLMDPFGFGAFYHATKYWTVAEKNSLLIPLKGLFLQNRLLWSFISILLLGITYKKFSFTEKMAPEAERPPGPGITR